MCVQCLFDPVLTRRVFSQVIFIEYPEKTFRSNFRAGEEDEGVTIMGRQNKKKREVRKQTFSKDVLLCQHESKTVSG